jgi:hypothetical protein
MKKVYSLLIAFLSLCFFANAQSQLGEIRGKVIDAKTKQPMSFVSVSIFLNGNIRATAITDDDGDYIVKTLQPGEYEVKVASVGYRNAVVTNVDVTSDNITWQNVNMESNENGQELKEVVVVRKKPLVDPSGKGGATFSSADLMARPARNINSAVAVVAGVDVRNGGTPNFRGARSDGTAYYVDGMRVNGSTTVPQFAVDQLQAITGGVPAQYGDFVGGAITITTKSPSKNFIRAFEYRTASPFYGYLDNSQYNELQAYISGPLKITNKGRGDKERVLLGFTIGGSGTYARNGSLPATDIYKVKDAKLREIQNTPLTRNPAGGFVNSAEYLTKDDLEKAPYKQNVAQRSFALSGNFVYSPVNNINVKLGYQASYFSGRNYSYSNSLLNSDNNNLTTGYTIRPYIQFTQSFSKKTDEDAKKSFISNAFYTVRLSYERVYSQSENPDFGQNYFNYGYVGKFKTYSMPFYTRVTKAFGAPADKFAYRDAAGNIDTLYLSSYIRQEAERIDTLVVFEQADINVIKGNYTKTVFDYYKQNNIPMRNLSQATTQGALSNGFEPSGIYSLMWGNVGGIQGGGFSKAQNETYALYVMSEASVGTNPKARHDLQFGFTYEQQFQRNYGITATSSAASGAGLWGLMGLLVNRQFAGNNDSGLAIVKFNTNGVFQDTVRFDPKIRDADQTNFDKNLREKLIAEGATDVNGNPITINSKIDVNLYTPNMYSLKLFSADELLNEGNSYVGYSGYDYLGNLVSGKQSVNKFLNDKQNRPIGAFSPIYMAAWVQDQFVFKDLIVRLGVRMERYDANQIVLKDPYSLAPIYSAGDVRRNNLLKLAGDIPSNIGDGYAVYVDSETPTEGETHITGFRDGNNWYDATGNPVTDPQVLSKGYSKISRNTPLLVNTGQKVPDANSFKEYVPDVKFLPRVWFSFPISTTSQFFGTYDVLAQRPTVGATAQIDDYYYLRNRLTGTIGNPDLKMTQVTDYQIGFRQQIGDNASLGIIAGYREFKNLMQLYRYTQAWPYDYTTIGNIDFQTVKSIQLEYELRDIGNITLSANYTLQFADGTGSNAGSSATLIQSGLAQQRNIFPVDFDTRHAIKGVIDYHYKTDKDYNGPIVAGKKIFERAGINFTFNALSGRPYTEIKIPITTTQDGIAQRSQTKGTINGAYLPAQFTADINIDKYFTIKAESLGGKMSFYSIRVYIEVQNVFNAANVLSVYPYTGSAYDDGYINSPQAKSSITNATQAQSFVDLYNIKMVNPNSFALPRLTRLGISLQF